MVVLLPTMMHKHVECYDICRIGSTRLHINMPVHSSNVQPTVASSHVISTGFSANAPHLLGQQARQDL